MYWARDPSLAHEPHGQRADERAALGALMHSEQLWSPAPPLFMFSFLLLLKERMHARVDGGPDHSAQPQLPAGEAE